MEFLPYAQVLLLSMLPIAELRGAIPFGVAIGLPTWPVVLIAVVGNLLPIPFVLLFLKKIFWLLRKHSKTGARVVTWLEERAAKKGEKLYRSVVVGLFLLVAIPLPGTGAWTGALVAQVFDIRFRIAFPAIIAGVVAAAILTTAATCGFASLL